jgi:hypothetical protein
MTSVAILADGVYQVAPLPSAECLNIDPHQHQKITADSHEMDSGLSVGLSGLGWRDFALRDSGWRYFALRPFKG